MTWSHLSTYVPLPERQARENTRPHPAPIETLPVASEEPTEALELALLEEED